ncbi:MAG: hypothetical protein L3K25_06165 [Gammaproteobacteria bacterium]|nr:hypothetical protein [Gammaproteobacteria bacterium]MCF6337219.1 hypothetical protein [Gammaproteobacteria bacterium]
MFEFPTGGISFINAGKVLVFVAAFFLLAPLAVKRMSLMVKRADAVSSIPGLIPTTIVSLVLFFAWSG